MNDYQDIVSKNESNKFFFQRKYEEIEFIKVLLENFNELVNELREGYVIRFLIL